MKTARYVSEQLGLVLAGSFILFPPEWQLAAFLAGIVLALCLHPVVHTALHIGALIVALIAVTLWRGLSHAWDTGWRLAAAIILIPFAVLMVLGTAALSPARRA